MKRVFVLGWQKQRNTCGVLSIRGSTGRGAGGWAPVLSNAKVTASFNDCAENFPQVFPARILHSMPPFLFSQKGGSLGTFAVPPPL